MTSVELLELPAVSQAQLLAQKKLSSLELTNLYLERIENLNPQFRAFSHIASRQARKAAQHWDKQRSQNGQPDSILSGVPIGIKDLSFVRFMPTQMGSRSFKYFISPLDDPNVKRLRQAGLIFLGKTTTSEFGGTPFTVSPIHPPTRNPWNTDHSPGGSSGGSAAAVAAKMIPLAHAADGGGSIRIPAALCGLVGFKASRGALHHIIRSDRLRLATEGAITRNIDDAIAFSSLLALNPKQFQIKPSKQTYRIVFHTQSPLAKTHSEIISAMNCITQSLAGQGHQLQEGAWPHYTAEDFIPMWCRTLANIPVFREALLQKSTRWFREQGKRIQHQTVQDQVSQIILEGNSWWGEGIDFHLSPTVSCLAPLIHDEPDEDIEKTIQRMLPLGAYTAMINVMGYAAISLPMGLSQSGLPMGLQIIAPQGHDAKLLQFAQQLHRG